ncbi:hypothetical protein NL108_014733 [Boleophthalmus pectinirostris]|nr:hypothetical protein NL108_014733 [Boleophthalmus pectinirostris]
MAPGATPVAESEDHKMCKSKSLADFLPQHSYWFDFWTFILFDIVLFLFVYFIVP